MRTLLDLKPHESANIDSNNWVLSVPGGFIYYFVCQGGITSCFVPITDSTEYLGGFPVEEVEKNTGRSCHIVL